MPLLWASGASACQLSSSLMRRRAAPREEEAISGGVIESLIWGGMKVVLFTGAGEALENDDGTLYFVDARCFRRPLLQAKHPLRHQARLSTGVGARA